MKINNIFANLLLLLSSLVTFAQPGDTNGPPDDLEGPDAGINSILFVLIIVGLILAFHSLNKNKKIG